MKVKLESFVDKNNFSPHSIEYVNEAILCYKVGAYRSAFIMSYLFLLNAIRHRVLENRYIPENISEKEWENRIITLRNEDKWEESIFEIISAKTSDKKNSRYFRISGKRVDDFKYWRKLRNDSVHAKDNIIDYPHVESLWLFIQSILPKMIVNGGKESLIEDIKVYFDNNLISYDSKVNEELVNAILNVCDEHEIVSFFASLHKELSTLSNTKYSFFNGSFYNTSLSSRAYNFWKQVSVTHYKNMDKKFEEFLCSDNSIFTEFIFLFPNKFSLFRSQNSILQHFIEFEIFNNINKPGANEILLNILTSDLLFEDLKKNYIQKIYDRGISEFLDEKIYEILSENGYFNLLKNDLMSQIRGGGIDFPALTHYRQRDVVYFLVHLNEELDETDKRFLIYLNKTLKYIDAPSFIEKISNVIAEKPTIQKSISNHLENSDVVPCESFTIKSAIVI